MKCIDLPTCRTTDYYMKPEDISKCKKENGTYYRNQKVAYPEWPGVNRFACKVNTTTKDPLYKKPSEGKVKCACLPGYRLAAKKSSVECEECPVGTYSSGEDTECKKCPAGQAAIPGFFIDSFYGEKITPHLKQNCSGKYCTVSLNIIYSFVLLTFFLKTEI